VSDIRVAVPNKYNYIIATSTNIPLPVSGLNKLVQEVTMAIITRPGQDLFDPDYGMGISDVLPRTASLTTDQSARADVAKGILKITEQIMQNQSTVSLPADEQLQSLDLVDVQYDAQNMGWEVIVRVTSAGGNTTTTNVVVRA